MNNNSSIGKPSISIFKGSDGKKIMVKKKPENDHFYVPHSMIDENDYLNGQYANYELVDKIDCGWNLSKKCGIKKSRKKQKMPGIIAANTEEYPSFNCCVHCLEEIYKELQKIKEDPNRIEKISNYRQISNVSHWSINKNEWCNGQYANYRLVGEIYCGWRLSNKCGILSIKLPGIIAGKTEEYPSFDCCLCCLEEICKELHRIEHNPKLLNTKNYY